MNPPPNRAKVNEEEDEGEMSYNVFIDCGLDGHVSSNKGKKVKSPNR